MSTSSDDPQQDDNQEIMVENSPKGASEARKSILKNKKEQDVEETLNTSSSDEGSVLARAANKKSSRSSKIRSGSRHGSDGDQDFSTHSYPVVPEADLHEIEASDNVLTIHTTEDKLREAERIIASQVFYQNSVPETLSTWAGITGIVQLAQTLILFLLVSQRTPQAGFWYTSYAVQQEGETSRTGGLIPDPQEVGDMSVLWLAPVVTLLSGLENIAAVVFRDTYYWYIARHQNPFRWTEYTISAPLVKVVVAHQVGVTDVHLLVCIFMLTALCIQCGATHESTNAKARSEDRSQNWRPFMTAWLGHLTAWGVIFNYFAAYRRAIGEDQNIWIICVFMFLLDTSFAVLFTLQWGKIGIFEDYVTGEKGWIALSFTAKTLLCWISIANGLESE